MVHTLRHAALATQYLSPIFVATGLLFFLARIHFSNMVAFTDGVEWSLAHRTDRGV